MQLIDRLTDDAIQQYNLLGDAGQQISFTLRFMPSQDRWLFDISYLDFVLNGVALTVALNALREFKNIINFGLAVSSTDGYEPQFLEDFLNGRIKIYLLNQIEVNSIEALFFT